MLRLENVSFAYGPVQAVHNVDLEVSRGELVAIVGGNGAGKSTLLKGIAGLLRPVDGAIRFQGIDISRVSAHRRVGQGISLCPEGREVFPDQSVHANLVLGAYSRSLSENELESELKEQWKRFPRLEERQGQLASTLSGGEQQMLALARALMARPALLMLDEPSLGLAPKIIEEIFRIIDALRREGMTILLVEQMANVALGFADRGYVLETGRVILQGTGRELLHDRRVQAAYLGSKARTARDENGAE